jgi:hypothetical protein
MSSQVHIPARVRVETPAPPLPLAAAGNGRYGTASTGQVCTGRPAAWCSR